MEIRSARWTIPTSDHTRDCGEGAGIRGSIPLPLAAPNRAAAGVTQAGMIVGTPEYLSPEQISGGAAGETSDLYALGVVAYEMFTGKKPFVHDELLRLLQMHLVMPPEPPSRHRPGLPDALETAILTLLRKDPQERFPSARAAGSALTAVNNSLRG